MKDFVNSIHSYHLFNYLVPGIIYVLILSITSNFDLIQKDILKAIFLYYFIGLVISRIGSLIIEPILLKLKFFKRYNFNDYVLGSKVDKNVGNLLETGNMYRGLISMTICIALTLIIDKIQAFFGINKNILTLILLLFLLLIFLFAWRKQNGYIKKRLKVLKNNNFQLPED